MPICLTHPQPPLSSQVPPLSPRWRRSPDLAETTDRRSPQPAIMVSQWPSLLCPAGRVLLRSLVACGVGRGRRADPDPLTRLSAFDIGRRRPAGRGLGHGGRHAQRRRHRRRSYGAAGRQAGRRRACRAGHRGTRGGPPGPHRLPRPGLSVGRGRVDRAGRRGARPARRGHAGAGSALPTPRSACEPCDWAAEWC